MRIVLNCNLNDIAINGVSVATDTDVSTLDSEKANAVDVYTKAEVDTGLGTKANTIASNYSQVKTALNASGTAHIYACRAWVNLMVLEQQQTH